MAGGKETPRQKMIGMMYLVLTAMLALNVSAEVLDAFRLVDEGIKNTTENYYKKNQLVYKEFQQKYAENEQKVGPWKAKSDEVKAKADELFAYIQNIKFELVMVTQGSDTTKHEGWKNGKVGKLAGVDRYDDPTRIMIGENHNGVGYELKEKIEVYREFLLELVDEEDTRVIDAIASSLNTEDPSAEDSEHGEHLDWEVKHFYHIPLGGIMPILSKMQADVRNTESEAIAYLYSKIDAGSFSFNKLEATVIPNTSYVLKGNHYEADVFLAAVDTTAPPIVYIGDYDSVVNEEDGTYEYRMKGNYDSLEIVNGKGKFSAIGGSIGNYEWGGIIKLRGPDGQFIQKTFTRSYQVAPPNLVVSPTKMNVFYVAIENPVSISISGVAGNKIFPSNSNGSITKQRDGEYIVKPRRPGNAFISVIAEIDGERKSMGTVEFRVRPLPTPVVEIAEKKGGKISKNVLAAQRGVIAKMENFEFDLNYTIVEFTISTTDQGGYYIDAPNKSNTFSKQQKDMINGLRRGSKLTVEEIKAVGPTGEVIDLAPTVFEII